MSSHPLLLGHRGSRSDRSIPENTFAAFDQAFEHGCDGFEFDLRLTSCGRALVCHDPKVHGVTVSRATCRELMDLPRLEEVLARYGRRGFLDIEIKVKGMETKVLDILRSVAPEAAYVVSSFLPDVVLEVKARSATVPVGIICERPSQLMRWRALPADYVIVHKSLVTRRLVQLVHAAGRKIFAWTVNDKKSMVRLAGWGVDGIISDKTGVLVETLGRNVGSV